MLHFRDIRRFSNINHLHTRIASVRRVLDAIQDKHLLTATEYGRLVHCYFNRPLFTNRTDLTLPTLGTLEELVNENWLGERIIDAMFSLLTSELNHTTPNLIRVLDCTFHMELSNSFHSKSPSRELIKLRDEFLVNPPVIVAFLLNKQECHWSPTATIPTIRTVLQGDSSTFPANENLRAMVEWWLRDVTPEDGEWDERSLAVEQQDAQSGSCGLASISSIVSFARSVEETLTGNVLAESSFIPWTNENSSAVRYQWMQLLLRAHLGHLESQAVRYASSFGFPLLNWSMF